MKYLRDMKGGTVMKLWSHLLKTSVMHLVIKTRADFWNNKNLENCFVRALQNLLEGMNKDLVPDVFFPEVNLLDRIKSKQVKKDTVGWLNNALNRYSRTGNVMDIFK